MFADANFYKTQYFGNKISDANLSYFLERGAEYITALTFNRVNDDTFPNLQKFQIAIKKANCAIADLLQVEEQSQGKTSESTGNWSVSYDNNKNTKQEINKVISMYLGRTGLTYMGVDTECGNKQ